MMCLGWMTRPECKARPQEQVTAPVATCPDVTWFWVGLGVIALGAVAKK